MQENVQTLSGSNGSLASISPSPNAHPKSQRKPQPKSQPKSQGNRVGQARP